MTAVIHKIFVGAGGKHTLSSEKKSPSKRKFWETTLRIDSARICVPLQQPRQ